MEASLFLQVSVHKIMQMNQEPPTGSPNIIHPTRNNPFCELYFFFKYFYRETELRLSFYKDKPTIFSLITTTKNRNIIQYHDVLQKGLEI